MLRIFVRVSWVAPIIKNLPAMLEMWVQSLHQVDSLEKRIEHTPGSSLENRMDRGEWQAIVHGACKRVAHYLATKQQQIFVRKSFK